MLFATLAVAFAWYVTIELNIYMYPITIMLTLFYVVMLALGLMIFEFWVKNMIVKFRLWKYRRKYGNDY